MPKKTIHELVSNLKKLSAEMGGKTPTLIEFVSSGESKRQIQNHKYSEIVKLAGLNPNPHSQTTPPVEVVCKPPRILAFDIETAPIQAYVWGLWENNVALNQIKSDWYLLSVCAKFLDSDEIFYFDQRNMSDMENDIETCKFIHNLISEADILLTHNGDKFDIKKLNARFIYHGLMPIAPKRSVDTLKIARRLFAFTSKKLEYIAKFLGCTPKDAHKKFPGFALWSECLKGNLEAFKEMETYNKGDVLTLIEVYQKLVRYDSSIQFSSYEQSTVCTCGEKEFYRDGHRHTNQGRFQIFRCRNCGKTFTAKENLIHKTIRKELPK